MAASIIWAFLLIIGLTRTNAAYHETHCAENRRAIVHLFEWKWSDIARECEEFLGPRGFCGVQTSPAMDHVVIPEGNEGNEPAHPWWERYQPVGYNLDSRSGTEAEFFDMVARCNAVNVRVYPDVIVNHMAGTGRSGVGIGGSEFVSDIDDPYFPNAGLGLGDFNDCTNCGGCCCINSWTDFDMVWDCPLVGLIDINLAVPNALTQTTALLNKFIDGGVAGFRMDTAKHVRPQLLEQVLNGMHDLNTAYFPAGSRPFLALEVIDMNQQGEVNVHMYTHLARVTEFRYCTKIGNAAGALWDVRGLYDPGWGMCEPENAFVFVDNHDNQRGHGSGSEVITYKEPIKYQMAQALTLGQDYGWPRVMSSYDFTDSEVGPPHNADWSTADVIINPDGSCGGGWVCEHRWPAIAGMVGWAKATNGFGGFDNWWQEGNKVAWSRGGRGFVALSNEGQMSPTLQTGLPAGDYCNVIQGCPTSTGCQGEIVTVNGDGTALVNINYDAPHILAIHVEALPGQGECTGEGGTPPPPTSTTTPGPTSTLDPGNPGVQTTIVYMYATTEPGQDTFIRGGIDHSFRPDCVDDAETSACAIDIQQVSLGSDPHYDKYTSWGYGDMKLDWYGAESNQGKHNGISAQGTPLAWTTNDPGNPAYQPDNQWGPHWWKLEVEMDCNQAEQGWFDVKTYVMNGNGWESDIQQGACTGDAGGTPPYSTNNHMARCGYRNIFSFGSGSCEISNI